MRSSPAADPKFNRIELTIAELAHGGDAVAITVHEDERRAVFIPGALPGERITADVDFATRPARARLVEILSPSASRTAVPCPHATACGGCDWMHIARISQPNFHGNIVRAHLPASWPASWKEMPITAHAAADGLRTRARLHVRSERKRLTVGFYRAGSHDVIEVDTCMALHPALDRARASLAALLEGARGDGEAEIALGQVREPDGDRKPVLDLRWSRDLPPTFFSRMDAAVAAGAWQGARMRLGESRVPATIGDPTPWARGGDGEPLRLAAGGFAQASEQGNVVLAKRVGELATLALERREEAQVIELFAGAGNFTVMLARMGAKLTAIESNAAACDAAQTNLRERKLAAKVVVGDADLFAIPSRADLVVLDPPRAGARGACEAIVKAKARHVIYVSCDPATLGRDLAILQSGGYAPQEIETFEMFPDTSHVETVISLAFVRPNPGRTASLRAPKV